MPIVSRRTRQMQPRNNGSVNIARSSIDQITPLAVRQQQNALAVDSFPVLYYKRKLTGQRCTCCGIHQDKPEPAIVADVEVLRPDGKATEAYMHSVLAGSAFSINRYGSRPRAVDANAGDLAQRTAPSPVRRSLEERHESTDLDDPFADVIEPSDLDDLYDDTGTTNNVAVSAYITSCGVCLGTGYVGGYDPVNAMRQVYDTQNPEWTGNIVLDTTVYPAAFNVLPNGGDPGYAFVPVRLPAGAVDVDCVRVWNNREQLTNIRIEVLTASGYIPAGSNLISKCDGLLHLFRISFDPNERAAFTHLEIQFDTGINPVYADWGKMSFTENLNTMDNLENVSVILSPTVPTVSLKDVMCESVRNRTWQVVNVQGSMDREKRLHGWEVSTRVVQRQELASLLPTRRGRTYYSGNRVQQEPRDLPGEHMIEPYTDTRGSRVR